MAKTPEKFVDEQWIKWQSENDVSTFRHIDTDELKELMISDLTYTSAMDVREYTLYQKWCEVKERYPTHEVDTLWGPEIQLIDPWKDKLLNKVKSNMWSASDPDDYAKLKPILKLHNGELAETWNAIRTFIHTMKNNSNIGRNLFYTVEDEVTGKYLGVICITGDFLDLTPRDTYIGWSRGIKTQQGMINHTCIGSTIVPIQPFGYNYMGGKLLALLCLSDIVQRDWKERYGDILVGVTTTSLYGKTKVNGLSQYDGLEHWQKMGFSSGSVAFEPDRSTRNMAYEWVKENHTRKYFEWWCAKDLNGLPYKRDHKNRTLSFLYSKLGIDKELTKAGHQRGIYFSPLYDNTCDFLRKDIEESDLVKSFDTSCEALSEIWKTKYAKGRISMLKKKKTISDESLFYDDLIFMKDFEEAKEKYLPQIGR